MVVTGRVIIVLSVVLLIGKYIVVLGTEVPVETSVALVVYGMSVIGRVILVLSIVVFVGEDIVVLLESVVLAET